MEQLPREALEHVAAYFGALAEPTRLRILQRLRQGECKVGPLAQLCNCSAANVSRHLSVLVTHGLVARQARGTSAYYRIADPTVEALCDLVCGSIGRRFEQSARLRQSLMPAGAGTTSNTQGETS